MTLCYSAVIVTTCCWCCCLADGHVRVEFHGTPFFFGSPATKRFRDTPNSWLLLPICVINALHFNFPAWLLLLKAKMKQMFPVDQHLYGRILLPTAGVAMLQWPVTDTRHKFTLLQKCVIEK